MNRDTLEAYPEYATTARLDQLRETDYGFLDEQGQVYLDFTGAGLAAASQHRAHEARMAGQIFGNPHSVNPTSLAATDAVERTRARVLRHLNASAEEYMVVFTSNASGAAKLIGEAYPFRRGRRLVLTADNHNSCNGLREFARQRGAKPVYVTGSSKTLRIDTNDVSAVLKPRRRMGGLLAPHPPSKRRSGLFVYPAQSNFSGCRHPLDWVALAQSRGYDVLLDAAAYLPTSLLDLSTVKPDFVIASWYKLFGYPTGLGCLIMRRDAAARLARPWFAGGTVLGVSTAIPDWHRMTSDESRFEDGTLNFLNIPDIQVGLDWLDDIGMAVVQTRVRCLTGYFLDRMLALRHSNGASLVRIYGPADLKDRGATVAFSFLDETGKLVDDALVASESSAARISLRTGCFCNPGAAEMAFGIDARTLRRVMRKSSLLGGPAAMPAARAIRVSFGLCSNVADVDRFVDFAMDTYLDRSVKYAAVSTCEHP